MASEPKLHGGGKPPFAFPAVLVTTAEQSTALDALTIDAGVPSRALMQRAGAAAAAEIARSFGDRLASGVAVFTGPGNNGGDAWVVARSLAATGTTVRVEEVAAAKTPDAIAERALARELIAADAPHGSERIVVDGLLGTGSAGVPRGELRSAIERIAARRSDGARVVALDVPSGLDATTGAGEHAVMADLTLAFGTVKRGHLVARGHCGRIVVLDIGLRTIHGGEATSVHLVDARFAHRVIPRFDPATHKGVRGKLAIIGGGMGMAGAAVLAARAAMRCGVGMVRCVVAPNSVPIVQAGAVEAIAAPWPEDAVAVDREIVRWAGGVLIGPGLGNSSETRALADCVLSSWRGPVVLDADALNVYEGDASALAKLLAGRPAVVTPHAAEFARLAGTTVEDVLANRFDIGGDLARRLGATVLLKGVPTVISAPRGDVLVSAAGTPALAQAGSGDVLSGIAATLLMQMNDPLLVAACAAWVHGRAAEIAQGHRGARGTPLSRIAAALEQVWDIPVPSRGPPVLAELPAIRG